MAVILNRRGFEPAKQLISKGRFRSPKAGRRRLPARAPKTSAAGKNRMRAAAIDRFGSPSVLAIHELPVPKPGPNEVLIALYAAGVGVWDADIRKGWWPQGKPKFPLVLGSDGAGVVAACGARVRRFSEGDRVWAYEFINRKGGFYAEYVALNSGHVALLPKRLNFVEAGASAVTGLTALQGIDVHLRVKARDTVLVFGATGAVGSLAVQFAKRHGARVVGTGRGKAAVEFIRKLGADKAVDVKRNDAAEQVREFAPNGFNAVLALAGGDSLQQLLKLVRNGGRIAYPNGVEPEPKRPPKVKLVSYDAEVGLKQFERLNQAVEEAKLKAPIAAVFSLEEAAKAHARVEKGHLFGRIALRIRSDKQASARSR